MVIPATSTEYLHVAVTAPVGTDLTGTPVRIAVIGHDGNPTSAEWKTAEWVGTHARLLIGPDSGLVLTRGTYLVWIAVDPPGAEHIVRRSGTLNIT
ncbi:hypothetical protein ACFTXJ_14350 [Streptomyces zhihengii]|uniref:hypothetical protein n=1 Tax=Streptomyces zhihengii TaxID=1818004 RepID=UPI00363D834E